LWQDDETREKVFRVIFRGPIAPGIETPEVFGLTKIIPKLSIQTNREKPFPQIEDYESRRLLNRFFRWLF
jgi:hypothetical protein